MKLLLECLSSNQSRLKQMLYPSQVNRKKCVGWLEDFLELVWSFRLSVETSLIISQLWLLKDLCEEVAANFVSWAVFDREAERRTVDCLTSIATTEGFTSWRPTRHSAFHRASSTVRSVSHLSVSVVSGNVAEGSFNAIARSLSREFFAAKSVMCRVAEVSARRSLSVEGAIALSPVSSVKPWRGRVSALCFWIVNPYAALFHLQAIGVAQRCGCIAQFRVVDEAVAFESTWLGVVHHVNLIDVTEGLENIADLVFGCTDMETKYSENWRRFL